MEEIVKAAWESREEILSFIGAFLIASTAALKVAREATQKAAEWSAKIPGDQGDAFWARCAAFTARATETFERWTAWIPRITAGKAASK